MTTWREFEWLEFLVESYKYEPGTHQHLRRSLEELRAAMPKRRKPSMKHLEALQEFMKR